MATVTFGLLNYTSINTAESTTGWTNFDTLDPDFAKEGSNAITDAIRADAETGYYTHGSALTASGKHVRMWINTINKAYMEPESNGGYEFLMYDGTTTEYRTMFGSDTYDGGWVNYVVDCALFTTLTLANVTRWGIRVQHTGTAKNIDNVWVDYIRYLDGYYVTGGTSGDELTLALIAARDIDDGAGTLRGYGIVYVVGGVYYCTGKLRIGNSSTTTYFKMDAQVLVFPQNAVGTGFHELDADGTVANITIKDSVIRAESATTNIRPVIDFSNTSITLSCTGNTFLYCSTIAFASGQTVTDDTFNDCGQITPGGADLTGGIVKNYEGSTGTAALLYNVNADPDGELDDMTFTKGTATTHAIELGSNCPSSITLRGWTTSGYNASNGQNDSTIYNNSGKSVTIDVVNGSGNFTYRNGSGASTTVNSSVTLTVTAKDLDNVVVASARVLLEAASGGAAPSDASVSITSSGGTASVSHTSHGMSNGDYVAIRGADQQEYNGVNQISNVSANAYDYTITGTPASPATGTITSTQVYINELTNASGIATENMNFGSTQPVRGTCRKSSPSDNPKYIAGRIVGDITSTGFSTTVIMVEDE